jgi:hypothetical protein
MFNPLITHGRKLHSPVCEGLSLVVSFFISLPPYLLVRTPAEVHGSTAIAAHAAAAAIVI